MRQIATVNVSRRVEHLPHLARQTIGRAGLLEVGDPGLEDAMMDDGVIGVARRVQHAQVGSQLQQPVCQLPPVNPRHHRIGQE